MIRSLPLFLLGLGLASAAGAAPAATPFTADAMLGALTRDLSAHFRLEGDLELEWVRPWTPPAATATTWEIVVTDYPTTTTSTLLLRCRVLADGANVGEGSLVVRAALWRDAWVSRQPLAAGSIFDPALLATQRIDALRERDALPATAGDRSSMFARQVPANRLLTWHDLARRPWVRKGEVIDAVAVDGGLQVTLKAQALENGSQGDIVAVRNLESRKDISALVVAENRVEVRF